MRKLSIFLFRILLIVLMSSFVISCTTSEDGDDDAAIEEEFNAELGNIKGDDEFEDGDDEELVEDSDSSADDDDDAFLADGGGDEELSEELGENDLQEELSNSVSTVEPEEPPSYPEDVPPAQPPELNNPQGGSNSGFITSKETFPRNDDFEALSINELETPQEDLGKPAPLLAEVDPLSPSQEAAKTVVPVSKIRTDPFFKNGRLMNAVYLVRPGDDLASISEKIYQSNKVSILLTDNNHITGAVEPGDKIYYTSPNRPSDNKTIQIHYEDNQMAAQYYTTEEGDDIQKIGKRLLGFDEAWKEIYAINESVQTQSLLPAGLQVRYWSGNELTGSEVDEANESDVPPPPAVAVDAVPIEEPPVSQVELDAPGETLTEIPPAANDPMAGSSDIAGSEELQPLPPDIEGAPVVIDEAPVDSGLSIVTMAGVALVLLAMAAFIAIQVKNRKKPVDEEGLPPSLEFTKV